MCWGRYNTISIFQIAYSGLVMLLGTNERPLQAPNSSCGPSRKGSGCDHTLLPFGLLLAVRLLLGCCCSQEQPTPHQPNTVFGSVCRLHSYRSRFLWEFIFQQNPCIPKGFHHLMTMPCMLMAHGQVGQTCMVSLAFWGFFFFSCDIIYTDMSQLLPFELWVRWYVHSR